MRCDECVARSPVAWCPNCPATTAVRALGAPASLAKQERLWSERRAEQQSGRRSVSVKSRVHRAVERYKQQAEVVADALLAATVTCPPPKRGSLGQRRGTDPSDPALAQITATHDAVDRGLTRFGHLLDDCQVCGPETLKPHNDDHVDTLARLLDDDWTTIVDDLTGVSSTSPYAVANVVEAARKAHTGGAERFESWFAQLHRDGAEPDVLENLSTRFGRMAGRMQGLADSLGQWVPGTRVRLCKNPGCSRPAPQLAPDATERGGAQCPRCVDEAYRARNEAC